MFIPCYNINSVCSNKNTIKKEFNLPNMYSPLAVETINVVMFEKSVNKYFILPKKPLLVHDADFFLG